jgi:cell wall-associated NlpC family hydrolase
MRRVAIIIALILVSECGAMAAPIKRAHRPWLMVGQRDERSELKVPDRPAPVIANPARPRPLSAPRIRPAPAPQSNLSSSEPTSDEAGEKLAKQAMKYEGTRYRFGGTSKRGLDCSGLIARIYEDLKMKRVPRASAALYKSGEPVTLTQLRPGDLVFFKNTYKRGISHVGVYAGNNRFVHASNHRRGVTVTALSDPYYPLHYAGARRLY